VGGRISFDESVREKLSEVELLVRRKYNNKFDIEWTDTNIRYRSNIEYTMGADGQLKAEDGSSVFFEDVIIEETKEVPEPPPAPSAIRERASLDSQLLSGTLKSYRVGAHLLFVFFWDSHRTAYICVLKK